MDACFEILQEKQKRISELEEMLADCERDYRQQVDWAIKLHKALRDILEIARQVLEY